MNVSIIYDKTERKFQPEHYSQTYNIMRSAIINSPFWETQSITEDCDAKDIDGDIILFYDIHSSHHIKIKGIENHPAIKYEYMDDPHQKEQKGTWSNGQKFYKLGASQRIERARKRGVKRIITPYYEGSVKYFDPYLKGIELLWIPMAVDLSFFDFDWQKWNDRNCKLLLTGSLSCGQLSFYDLRKKFYLLSKKSEAIKYTNGIYSIDYWKFLTKYKYALGLCELYAVPKYYEIAAAGCIPLLQWNMDACRLGFRHRKNCLFVDLDNIDKTIEELRIMYNQHIAENAKKLIEENYTIKHFQENLKQIFERDKNE